MLETSARLLRMLSLLQAPREWTGAELAARLDVSPRTVRKDVERLRNLGYPVHASRGSTGGYRLAAGASLPPLLLDDDEAVAVAIGLRTVASGTIAGIEETSVRALAKLEQVLPARLRHRVRALHTAAIRASADEPGPQVTAADLTTIAAAIRDRERLRFHYESYGGEASRREVEPYRMVNWGRRWYLVGWDVARDDWRTFRLDRMTLRTPNGPRFRPRELPDDVADRVMRGASAAAWRIRARVVVHAPAAEVADRINPAVGVVEAVDDQTCVLGTGADSAETLAVHLSLLGFDFTVTEPAEVVAYIRALADRYARATT